MVFKNVLIFYIKKLFSSGLYYLLTIFFLAVDQNSGRVLSFFDFHRSLAANLDLYSIRSASLAYREYWQGVKFFFLALILFVFIVVIKNFILAFIFLSYLYSFFLLTKSLVYDSRVEKLIFKFRFYSGKHIYYSVRRLFHLRSEVFLLFVTAFGSISYGFFYLTLKSIDTIWALRIFDFSGFVLSYIYLKYLIQRNPHSKYVFLFTLLCISASIIFSFYFSGIIFSIFVLLRHMSGILSSKLFGDRANEIVTIMSLVNSLGYWYFHIYSYETSSFIIVILFEIISLSIGIRFYLKKSKLC